MQAPFSGAQRQGEHRPAPPCKSRAHPKWLNSTRWPSPLLRVVYVVPFLRALAPARPLKLAGLSSFSVVAGPPPCWRLVWVLATTADLQTVHLKVRKEPHGNRLEVFCAAQNRDARFACEQRVPVHAHSVTPTDFIRLPPRTWLSHQRATAARCRSSLTLSGSESLRLLTLWS